MFTITPALSHMDPRLRLTATGTLGSGDLTPVASRGMVNALFMTPALGPVRFEVGGGSGWDGFDPTATTGWWHAEARAHLDARASGLWLGAQAGRALDGTAWHPVTSFGSGVWLRVGGTIVTASVATARVLGLSTEQIPSHTGPPPVVPESLLSVRVPDSIVVDTNRVSTATSTTDAQAGLAWQRGPLALALTAGRRFAETGDGLWGGAQAMLWLSNRVAVVASGGTMPTNPIEGRPATRYMTFGFHYARRSTPPGRDAPRGRQTSAASPAFDVREIGGGERQLALRVPGARSVEIMGDFTDWTPVALARDDAGRWVVSLSIPSGSHRMNMRVDGGAWRVPPGLAPVNDDFNGTTGILIVR
jgi:hypothetical protein